LWRAVIDLDSLNPQRKLDSHGDAAWVDDDSVRCQVVIAAAAFGDPKDDSIGRLARAVSNRL
jgi:hypothetical protein